MRVMTIREFYLKNYPTDELGLEINETATFPGLLNLLTLGGDVYEYIGVGDSWVRELVFKELAERTYHSTEWIYNLWRSTGYPIS
jgi:hypothetical protein